MKKIARATSLSVMALVVVVSASACSGFIEVTPTGGSFTVAATPDAETGNKNAAETKKTVDAFLADVSRETNTTRQTDSFREEYASSYSYLQPDIPYEDARDIIETFSFVYMMDPEAKIETEEKDFVVEGDYARISGADFAVTINGKRIDSSQREDAGTLVLHWDGTKWLLEKVEK